MKLRKEVKILIGLIGIILILTFIQMNSMNLHIERVSKKCAEKGQGIVATYTKEGDKFYVCENK